jgi:RNA polymerase sigma factor (sigma-70 family)
MAEDMAQDAFVKAFRALRTFRGDAAFSTWLTAIAMNSYRSCLRDREPVVATLDPARAVNRGADPFTGLQDQERAALLRRAVLALPVKYREPLVLYYFQEMDLVETARVLGIPEGTVKGAAVTGQGPPAAADVDAVCRLDGQVDRDMTREPDMDDLDRLLSNEEALVPSSGFASSVMEAVQDAADEPPPLRFPWWRFSVGVLGCIVWAGAAISVAGELDLAQHTAPLLSLAAAGAAFAQWALAIALVSLAVCGVRLLRQD